MQQNKEVINQWSESAPYWEKYREVIRQMLAPVTQALVEDAEIASGSAVLDVATGPGEPALTIAGVVGPEGKVVGTDVVPAMVEAARREAERRGLRHASFEVAFAESLPFSVNAFDAVVSRFGVMFFPSPVESMREWLRVLKPGGKIALAAWHFVERNPFFHSVSNVIDRYVAPTSPTPASPDAFRFAEPGKLQAVLSEAGVTATSERVLQFSICAPISVEDFWTLRCEISEKLRSRIATLSKQELAALQREGIEALNPYAEDHCIAFPAEVLIVSGKKALS
jgi:ubiquinone/menaquinone biosynthesis C-methylase UbiE